MNGYHRHPSSQAELIMFTSRFRPSPFLSLLTALALVGCGDDGAEDPGQTGSGADAGTSTADRSTYPAGPYGGNVDQTLPNLVFTAPDGTSLDLQTIRSDAANSILFINTAAFWCGACIEEQPALAALHTEYASRGLQTLVTVFETADQTPADAGDAGRWKTSYNLPFLVVADIDAAMTEFYDARSTPLNMLVDLSSMTVLYRSTGTDVDAIEQLIAVLLSN